MLHEHDGEARILRQRLQELRERLEAARLRADPGDY